VPLTKTFAPIVPPATGVSATKLVDGDPVNMDDLYDEVSPGATPKLTLGLLASYISSLTPHGSVTQVFNRPIYDSSSFSGGQLNLFFGGGVTNTLANFSLPIYYVLDIPNGATIKEIKVFLQGNASGVNAHAGVPSTPPKFKLFAVSATLGTSVSQIGNNIDPSASGGAMDTLHAIDSGAISVGPVDRTTTSYIVEVDTEAGTNAQPHVNYYGAQVTYSFS